MAPKQATVDREKLLDVVARYLKPEQLPYRTSMGGKMQSSELVRHAAWLKDIRALSTFLNQSTLEPLIKSVCESKESTWHLGNEIDTFSKETALSLRAMLRDVQQTLVKHKSDGKIPSWCAQFQLDENEKKRGG